MSNPGYIALLSVHHWCYIVRIDNWDYCQWDQMLSHIGKGYVLNSLGFELDCL